MRIPLILGWTSDGQALVYQRLYRDHEYLDSSGQWVGALFRYDLASGVSTPIETPYGLGIGVLSFSPSGPLVACAVSTDYLQMELQLGALDGVALRLTTSLAEGYVYAFPLQWSPDGRWLLVSVAPRMSDPYDPGYPRLVRNTLYPPIDLRYSRIWAYDDPGQAWSVAHTGRCKRCTVPERRGHLLHSRRNNDQRVPVEIGHVWLCPAGSPWRIQGSRRSRSEIWRLDWTG